MSSLFLARIIRAEIQIAREIRGALYESIIVNEEEYEMSNLGNHELFKEIKNSHSSDSIVARCENKGINRVTVDRRIISI